MVMAAILQLPLPRRIAAVARYSEQGSRATMDLMTLVDQHAQFAGRCDSDPGADLVAVFDEADVSGTLPLDQRPGLLAGLKMVEDGDADDLMFAYADRAFRNGKVQDEVMERLAAAGGRLLTLDMGEMSYATAASWQAAKIKGVIDEGYARSVRERSAAGQKKALEQGRAFMRSVPVGYVKGPDKRLRPADAAIVEVVREAFRLRAEGATERQVRDHFAEHGVRYTTGGVRKLLASRIYLGELHFGANVNLTAHEPIVDPELWRAAQRTVSPRGRQPKERRLLNRLGVLHCACGSRMSLSHGERNGKRYYHYLCGTDAGECPRKAYISATLMEEAVLDELRRLLPDDLRETESTGVEVDEARSAAEAAQAQLDRTIRLYAKAGAMDEPVAAEEIAELKVERDRREEHVRRLARLAAQTETVTVADLDTMPLDELRVLVKSVFERITVAPGRGVDRITFQPFTEASPSLTPEDGPDAA